MNKIKLELLCQMLRDRELEAATLFHPPSKEVAQQDATKAESARMRRLSKALTREIFDYMGGWPGRP